MQPSTPTPTSSLRHRVVGVDQLVPLLDGTRVPYVNLDNAASTPPLKDVLELVNEFMPYYSSVHRGTGFKSRLSTEAYEHSRHVVGRFVGADPATNTVVFGKNTSEALNKLAYRFELEPQQVVVSTQMEHHSNDLPWRPHAEVVHVRSKPCGRLDEDHLDEILAEYGDRIAVLTVTAASNVTGYIQPVHRLARKAHAVGASIVVDAAQIAAHRRIDMRPDDDPEHLDFVTIAAHKMYAPLGTGALIGRRDFFETSAPEYRGGGTVALVTLDDVAWADAPEREEAGSPNVVGAVAMARAIEVLESAGMEAIASHEAQLLRYALAKLADLPGVVIYGESDPDLAVAEKVGVVPLNVDGVPHALAAAIAGYEGGIGVRNGCFCAHPYVVRLLDVGPEQVQEYQTQVLSGDRSQLPGMVRMSIGCYNSEGDIDRLVSMLGRIAEGSYEGRYEVDPASGDYTPEGYSEPLAEFFPWLAGA
ncbi:MAG: aminotransferase class V-fold PLP-dependent enzyme [Anaerolineae bacterium]